MNHQTHFDPEIAEDKTAAKLRAGVASDTRTETVFLERK